MVGGFVTQDKTEANGCEKMITKSEYNRNTAKYWIGKKVKVGKELQTSVIVVPPGTIMEIVGKRGGFSLSGERCQRCGIRPIISQVDPCELMLLHG